MHWPAPLVSGEVPHDRGPVMTMIEYRIDPSDSVAFLSVLKELSHGRRRDGDPPKVSHFLAPETDRFERPEDQAKTQENDP